MLLTRTTPAPRTGLPSDPFHMGRHARRSLVLTAVYGPWVCAHDDQARARCLGDVPLMPVVIRDSPQRGDAWGWYANELPMHIQRIHGPHPQRVWLERDGRRIFEPDPPMAHRRESELRAVVSHHLASIERAWISSMVRQGWLTVATYGQRVVLTVYASSPEHRRSVKLDLGDSLPLQDAAKPEVHLDGETAELVVVFSQHKACLDLRPLLWEPDWTPTFGVT